MTNTLTLINQSINQSINGEMTNIGVRNKIKKVKTCQTNEPKNLQHQEFGNWSQSKLKLEESKFAKATRNL